MHNTYVIHLVEAQLYARIYETMILTLENCYICIKSAVIFNGSTNFDGVVS